MNEPVLVVRARCWRWRLLTAVAVFLVLFIVRNTPMGPLLRLSTHPTRVSA